MWSDKKYINVIINISIVLMAMNFLHYGQIFLPLICLLLFVDNNFKFKVNNLKTFIVLCLLFVFIVVFSFRISGIYSFMGIIFPLAYYVGSNIKRVNETTISQLIFLIAIGMGIHVVLNFMYDFSLQGTEILFHQGRYDIWYKDKVNPTTTAVNYTFMLLSIPYIIFEEKNKIFKYPTIVIFVIMCAYEVALGRRTPIVMFLISSILYFLMKLKTGIDKKIVGICLGIFMGILVIVAIASKSNDQIANMIKYNPLIQKILLNGLKSGRFEVLIDSIKLYPKYLWGGQYISEIVGEQVHDLWGDIYNTAGIVPFILLLIYSVNHFITVCRAIKNHSLKNSLQYLAIPYFVCSIAQLLMEPAYSGASIFVMCVIVVNTAFDKYLIDNKC